MVKHDLEQDGIPYMKKEGYADFHASGRHSHITGLLHNGASSVEDKELARHIDIRMTMRYTHIGPDDQAKALKGLPAPSDAWKHIGSDLDTDSASWQRIGSDSRDIPRPEMAWPGTPQVDERHKEGDLSTDEKGPFGTNWPSLAPSVNNA